MNNKFKNLQIETLDKKLSKVSIPSKPKNGWVKALRRTLGMPASYLAKKVGVSQQTISSFEKNEVEETITIKSLRNLAEAMECELHYVLLPKPSLKKIIEKQSYNKALGLVKEVNKTMTLEDQKVNSLESSTKMLAQELAQNPNAKLWEEND